MFFRKKREDQYSIENVYASILPIIKTEFEVNKIIMPYLSHGVFKRLGNILYTIYKKSKINHITGDVHYVSIFLKRRRNVITIHDVYPLFSSRGIKRKLIKLIWFDLPIYRSKNIITVSHFSKSEISSKLNVDESRIKVIHNCIADYYRFSNNFQINDLPRILHIGTKPNKNLIRLVKALKGFPCKLIIVGKPDGLSLNVLKELKVANEVHTKVSNQNLYALYKECDMVSFVSTYEGFGMPIIEAQAVGRPVLTSNCASMPEIAGEGALLVDPFSIDEIRAGVRKILKDEEYRAKLVELGRENVKRFNSKDIGEEYLKVYRNIASS